MLLFLISGNPEARQAQHPLLAPVPGLLDGCGAHVALVQSCKIPRFYGEETRPPWPAGLGAPSYSSHPFIALQGVGVEVAWGLGRGCSFPRQGHQGLLEWSVALRVNSCSSQSRGPSPSRAGRLDVGAVIGPFVQGLVRHPWNLLPAAAGTWRCLPVTLPYPHLPPTCP